MTLTLNSALGELVKVSFGVNEIASAIVVGKAIGSVVTRQGDSANINIFAKSFGISLEPVPKHLQNVNFSRSGTIVGRSQRSIPVNNTFEGLSIDSVAGVASLMVLILRHIESVDDMTDRLEKLLKGEYWLVQSPFEPETSEGLPYSSRQILRSFINGVVDADMDSPQLNETRSLMAQLVHEVGGSDFMKSMSPPSKQQLHGLLNFIFGKVEPYPTFNTMSAGVALVALAAAANGVAIKVQCYANGQENPFVLKEPHRSSVGTSTMLLLNLWLVEPPPDTKMGPEASVQNDRTAAHHSEGTIPIMGGHYELAKFVSRRMQCGGLADPVAVDLWTRGIDIGSTFRWKTHSLRQPAMRQNILYRLNMQSPEQDPEFPTPLIELARKVFGVPHTDPRHLLADHAATIYHGVIKYRNYALDENLEERLRFLIVAIFVGALGQLASESSVSRDLFAWTMDCEQVFQEAESAVVSGIPAGTCITLAGRIWGGLSSSSKPSAPGDLKEVGIMCPQLTVLFNILADPEEVAANGISNGVFTLYRGSMPLLPRQPANGSVYGAVSHDNRFINRLRDDDRVSVKDSLDKRLLFTIEPISTNSGILAASICAWWRGEVVLELEPYATMHRLTLHRSFPFSQVDTIRKSPSTRRIFANELLEFRNGFEISGHCGIVIAGSRTDLQVAAAGCHKGPDTVLAFEDEARAVAVSSRSARGPTTNVSAPSLTAGTLIILCREDYSAVSGAAVG